MTIPAKLQSYMACGIPSIACAIGETDRIINESNSGVCCKPGDAEALAEKIIILSSNPKEELKQLGNNARKYYDTNFNKQMLLDKMDNYFNIEYGARRYTNV